MSALTAAEVELPQAWDGREVFFHMGSATSNLYLWVNGKFVGLQRGQQDGRRFQYHALSQTG